MLSGTQSIWCFATLSRSFTIKKHQEAMIFWKSSRPHLRTLMRTPRCATHKKMQADSPPPCKHGPMERMLIDLQILERRFIETNYRTLEVEQSFALTQLDPAALLRLRETGSCELSVSGT